MRFALLIESAPDEEGRVHLTAFWMQNERLRGQCFRTNPTEHFKGHETQHFADEEKAKAWARGENECLR